MKFPVDIMIGEGGARAHNKFLAWEHREERTPHALPGYATLLHVTVPAKYQASR